MPKINKTGQKFYGASSTYKGVIEIIGTLRGHYKWLAKLENNDQYAVDDDGFCALYGSPSATFPVLGKEIVPLSLKVGGFYLTAGGHKICIYRKHKHAANEFIGIDVTFDEEGSFYYGADGTTLSEFDSIHNLIKETTPE